MLLFRFFVMSENSIDNPMYEVVFRKFFFSMLPLMNFAVYFDDYAAMSGREEEALKAMYVRSIFSMWAGHIEGKAVLIQPEIVQGDSPQPIIGMTSAREWSWCAARWKAC